MTTQKQILHWPHSLFFVVQSKHKQYPLFLDPVCKATAAKTLDKRATKRRKVHKKDTEREEESVCIGSVEDHILSRKLPLTMTTPKNAKDDDSLFSEGDDDLHSDSCEQTVANTEERDEVKEIQRMAQKETRNVVIWRLLVTFSLLLTAVAVTATTYFFLIQEQENNFETAFEQFARTVGDAAIEQQRNIREAYVGLTKTISASAKSVNATWPYYTLPFFESYAINFLVQSGAEVFTVFNIANSSNRDEFTKYANDNYEAWVEEAHMIRYGNLDNLRPEGYHPYIGKFSAEGFVPDDEGRERYFSAWSYSPPPFSYGLINWNLATIGDYGDAMGAMLALKNQTIVTRVRPYSVAVGTAISPEQHEAMHSKLSDSSTEHPHSFMFHPIHEDPTDYNSEIVALLGGGVAWDRALLDLLPDGVVGIDAIISNNCNQSFTYEINGHDAIFKGAEDTHDRQYDSIGVTVDLALHDHDDFETTPGHCLFEMSIYPNSVFYESYNSPTPEIFAVVVACTFLAVTLVFFVYDMFVQRRNNKLVERAARSNAIVSSMFPGAIRDRLIGNEATEELDDGVSKRSSGGNLSGKRRLKHFLNDGESGEDKDTKAKPLADLFLDTTVLFADICGFTAWSSVREPTTVFTLLESVFSSFDEVAKARRIFKVETVGDCYVAVAGLPDPRKDHAIAMARFARDILTRMQILTKELEVSLGPDTGDLTLRIGLHSGPVTGGVLRGSRSRFQLFGDTMNTCARMESSGTGGRIHVSQETATLLTKAGKARWLIKREDVVTAKGKGQMQTYFLNMSRGGGSIIDGSVADPTDTQSSGSGRAIDGPNTDKRTLRLIDWNVETFLGLIKQILARRTEEARSGRRSSRFHAKSAINDSILEIGDSYLDEIKEIITLPEFDNRAAKQDPDSVDVPPGVISELREYVRCIAQLYNPNAFHNFDHASHVIMSVVKLMSRIVAPEILDDHEGADGSMLHDHTYGITSDPLTQFACAFAALIHDVDHSGVPNATLVKEGQAVATRYKNLSPAEQNSLEIAWDLLMHARFSNLRGALYQTEDELRRFRQLLVNAVMATDIADKSLKVLRNNRWDKAFAVKAESKSNVKESKSSVDRKATIVIEHLIQASDVAHTMQHWHVFRKWNERLFKEMYKAYQEGRADKDPAEFWYEGEIGFFDFYIIPLAKKLKDCGVFGKSSDEYLNYAMNNREEWKARGREVVDEMVKALAGGKSSNPQ